MYYYRKLVMLQENLLSPSSKYNLNNTNMEADPTETQYKPQNNYSHQNFKISYYITCPSKKLAIHQKKQQPNGQSDVFSFFKIMSLPSAMQQIKHLTNFSTNRSVCRHGSEHNAIMYFNCETHTRYFHNSQAEYPKSEGKFVIYVTQLVSLGLSNECGYTRCYTYNSGGGTKCIENSGGTIYLKLL
jgi:hypothetical protein